RFHVVGAQGILDLVPGAAHRLGGEGAENAPRSHLRQLVPPFGGGYVDFDVVVVDDDSVVAEGEGQAGSVDGRSAAADELGEGGVEFGSGEGERVVRIPRGGRDGDF